jgi:hypothetical protein
MAAKLTPKSITVGMKVDYHSVIGGPVTRPGCVVLGAPFQLEGSGRRKGAWVCFIDGMRGFVACDALTRSEDV